MATQIRHILVAIGDVRRAPRSELRKAGALARAARATVELFHAIEEPDPGRSFPETASRAEVDLHRSAIVEKYRRRLERFARDASLRGVTVRSTVVWDYPPHAAVIRRALAARSGLVIAAARGHRFGARLLLRNTDWELIRHCPVPLLLVKSPRTYRRPLILAAVDPRHTHARPADLDARLSQTGGEIARLLHGSLQVFHAYMPLVTVQPMVAAAAPLVMMPPAAVEAPTQRYGYRGHGRGIALGDHALIHRQRSGAHPRSAHLRHTDREAPRLQVGHRAREGDGRYRDPPGARPPASAPRCGRCAARRAPAISVNHGEDPCSSSMSLAAAC